MESTKPQQKLEFYNKDLKFFQIDNISDFNQNKENNKNNENFIKEKFEKFLNKILKKIQENFGYDFFNLIQNGRKIAMRRKGDKQIKLLKNNTKNLNSKISYKFPIIVEEIKNNDETTKHANNQTKNTSISTKSQSKTIPQPKNQIDPFNKNILTKISKFIKKNKKLRKKIYKEFELYHKTEAKKKHEEILEQKKKEEEKFLLENSYDQINENFHQEPLDQEIANFFKPTELAILSEEDQKKKLEAEEKKKQEEEKRKKEVEKLPKPWPVYNFDELRSKSPQFDEYYLYLIKLGVPELDIKEYYDKGLKDKEKVLKKILFELHRKEMNHSTFKAIDGLLIKDYHKYIEEFIIPLIDIKKFENFEFEDLNVHECFDEGKEFTERWDLEKQNKRDFEFIFERILEIDSKDVNSVYLQIKR